MDKEVPEPAGYELREKRSAKTEDARTWLPADALYAASQQMLEMPSKGRTPVSIFIAYRYKDEAGKYSTNFKAAGETADIVTALEIAKGRYLSWENED